MPTTTLPLGTEVDFRGMTGTDEDLLANQTKVRSGDALNEVMANCISRLAVIGADPKTNVTDADIKRLREPDRKALLFAIRRESYGDDVLCELQCDDAECREKFAVTVDLSELPTKLAPTDANGNIDPGPYAVKVSLPDVKGDIAEREIFVDFLDGRREQELAKTKDNLMSQSMFLRMRSVEGVHPNKVFAWLQSLTVRHRKALRAALAKVECGIDSTRKTDCPGCGQEVEFDVSHQPGFFFPQG